ncbi:hypothetical protein JCM10296v2_002120 [Rhodotorula toruloides]
MTCADLPGEVWELIRVELLDITYRDEANDLVARLHAEIPPAELAECGHLQPPFLTSHLDECGGCWNYSDWYTTSSWASFFASGNIVKVMLTSFGLTLAGPSESFFEAQGYRDLDACWAVALPLSTTRREVEPCATVHHSVRRDDCAFDVMRVDPTLFTLPLDAGERFSRLFRLVPHPEPAEYSFDLLVAASQTPPPKERTRGSSLEGEGVAQAVPQAQWLLWCSSVEDK